MRSQDNRLTIAVIYATTGRSDTLKRSVDVLASQTKLPNKIVISCARQSDADGILQSNNVDIIFSDVGLPKQRNFALKYLNNSFDILIFFDDDFIPHTRWIENVEKVFTSRSDVACVTGYVIADGIKGPGLAFEEGLSLLKDWKPPSGHQLEEGYSPYGCNMAFRCAAIKGLYFDEKLPLYGWQEDRDFGAIVASHGGSPVLLYSAGGVHLGVKSGRTSGVRLGYSQIINPIYLLRKGTMSAKECAIHVTKNLASNVLFSFYSEPYIDRRGRLRGNIIGMKDFLLGRIDPEQVMRIN